MSAPIFLLQWGSLEKESDDIGEIKALLEDKYKVEEMIEGERIDTSDKKKFLSKLKACLKSPNLQILYIACHGNLNGIVYDADGTSEIRFEEFFKAVRTSGHDVENPITLIFGFCHAMDRLIEEYSPEWVIEVVGFKNTPTNLDVCELGAGVIADINDYGAVLGRLIKVGWPKHVSPEDFPSVMMRFAELAEKQHQKKPKRFLRANAKDVVIASRSENGAWKREDN